MYRELLRYSNKTYWVSVLRLPPGPLQSDDLFGMVQNGRRMGKGISKVQWDFREKKRVVGVEVPKELKE